MSDQVRINQAAPKSLSEKARRLLAAHDREVDERKHNAPQECMSRGLHMAG